MRRARAALAIVAVSLSLAGFKGCTAEGPGGTPLPVHMWATWQTKNEGGDVKRTPNMIRPGPDFYLKGKTPQGWYVWFGPKRPLSNSGP